MNHRRHAGGFTLIELIVAMVVSGIVVGLAGMMVTTPINAYLAQSRRVALGDSAETAVRTLSSDIRGALPNSVRTQLNGNVWVLEMVEVQDATLFQTMTPSGFNPLTALASTVPVNGVRLVVGNRPDAEVANSAYRSSSGVITPAGAVSINAARDQVTINPSFTFTQNSAHGRAYIVSNIVRYRCDLGTGELRRVRAQIGDNIDTSAPIGPSELIASGISACSFQVAADGTAAHGGVAIVRLTITRNTNGNAENLRMVRQIAVENAA